MKNSILLHVFFLLFTIESEVTVPLTAHAVTSIVLTVSAIDMHRQCRAAASGDEPHGG